MVSTYLFASKERRSAAEVPGSQGGFLLRDTGRFSLSRLRQRQVKQKENAQPSVGRAFVVPFDFNRGVRPAAKSEE